MEAPDLTVISPVLASRSNTSLNPAASVPPTEYVRESPSRSRAVTDPTTVFAVAFSFTENS